MINNPKLKYFINYLVIPILIYIGVTFFVALFCEFVLGLRLNPVLSTAIGEIFSLLILYPLFLSAKKDRGDKVEKINLKYLLYLIPIGFSLAVFSNMFLELSKILPYDQEAKFVSESIMSLSPVMIVVTTIITVPIVEELVFRGFIYKTLDCMINKYLAMFFSSLLFGLAHGNLSQGLYAFFVGFVFCYLYDKLNNIIYIVFIHSIMNFSSIFIINSMLKLNDKEKLFLLIISIFLFIITIYRLNIENNSLKGGE